MITLTEFSRSAESARASRLIYEDMALVAHLSSLEQLAVVAQHKREARALAGAGRAGDGFAAAIRRSVERVVSTLLPHSPASAK